MSTQQCFLGAHLYICLNQVESETQTYRCNGGHELWPGAQFCPQCGQPAQVVRTTCLRYPTAQEIFALLPEGAEERLYAPPITGIDPQYLILFGLNFTTDDAGETEIEIPHLGFTLVAPGDVTRLSNNFWRVYEGDINALRPHVSTLDVRFGVVTYLLDDM